MLRWLDKFEEFVSSWLLILMSIVIIMQVFFRYCLSASLDWPEELGRYLFIASVYIGSSYAEQKDKHLSITILRTAKWSLAKYMRPFALIVTIGFCALMTWWGIRMIWFVQASQQVMPALQAPMWIVYAVVPLGMGCMAIRSFINLIRLFSGSTGQEA